MPIVRSPNKLSFFVLLSDRLEKHACFPCLLDLFLMQTKIIAPKIMMVIRTTLEQMATKSGDLSRLERKVSVERASTKSGKKFVCAAEMSG